MRGVSAWGALFAALAVGLTACSLVSPLDHLDVGSASGGGGEVPSAGPAASSGTSSGSDATTAASTGSTSSGDGGGGQGGAGGSADASGGAGATSPYAEAVNASGPVLYLRLGEGFADTEARDETGMYLGFYRPGAVRGLPGALAGDPSTAVSPSTGSNPKGAVTVNDVLGFDGADALPFSLELWFRIRAQATEGSGNQFLLAKDGSAGTDRSGYLLAVFPQQADDGRIGNEHWALGFERRGGGEDAAARYPFDTPLEPSTWIHLVGTFQPGSDADEGG